MMAKRNVSPPCGRPVLPESSGVGAGADGFVCRPIMLPPQQNPCECADVPSTCTCARVYGPAGWRLVAGPAWLCAGKHRETVHGCLTNTEVSCLRGKPGKRDAAQRRRLRRALSNPPRRRGRLTVRVHCSGPRRGAASEAANRSAAPQPQLCSCEYAGAGQVKLATCETLSLSTSTSTIGTHVTVARQITLAGTNGE